MEFNKHLRSAAVVLFGTVATFQVNAFSGTVIYRPNPTNATLIERASTTTARVSPEVDATYQRTMRKAQSAAVASKAAGRIIKSLAGVGTIIALAQLAIDLKGIWGKDATGNNTLSAPDPASCSVGPCYQWANQQWAGTVDKWFSSVGAACALSASVSGYTLASTSGNMCYFENMGGIGLSQRTVDPVPAVQKIFTDVEVEGLLKTGNRLPVLLDELDDKGYEIPWDVPEVEDMPQPLVLNPKVTVKPDGSKIIEQTTLTPYRAPDGTTVNWDRKATVTMESPPDANGNTVKNTTTTTDKAPASESKKDDRSECEKSPDTLGCIKLDTPDGEIPKSQKNVSYVAESLFGAASCPATKTINQVLTGRSVVLSYAPTCDVLANYVKPLIIAIALYMAYLIILPGNQQ